MNRSQSYGVADAFDYTAVYARSSSRTSAPDTRFEYTPRVVPGVPVARPPPKFPRPQPPHVAQTDVRLERTMSHEPEHWTKAELKHFFSTHGIDAPPRAERAELAQLATAFLRSVAEPHVNPESGAGGSRPPARAPVTPAISRHSYVAESPDRQPEESPLQPTPQWSHTLAPLSPPTPHEVDEDLAYRLAHEETALADSPPDAPPRSVESQLNASVGSMSASGRPLWNRQWSKELEARIAQTKGTLAEDEDEEEEDFSALGSPEVSGAPEYPVAPSHPREIPNPHIAPKPRPGVSPSAPAAPRRLDFPDSQAPPPSCPGCKFKYLRAASRFCSRCGARRPGQP
eukprot:TRINITY_DN8592_c0_g1_i1.p1 TRINITY_DN8592_c0_g1~~TRINITY_DN8592_c0_g1_i1.p1  ORF type:complete len:343 (-),score=23.59 TRINITY_DN8592_c0_g1_i1:281-1309(-)